MTTPRRAARRTPSREQWIAALLVGAVVVLLGFASGLGLSPASLTTQAALPTLSTDATGAAGATSTATETTAAPPVEYIVEPVPPAAPQPIATTPAAPSPSATTASMTGSASSAPTPAPASTSQTSAPPAPTCSGDILTSLLNTLLPNRAASGDLPVLGGLLASLLDFSRTLSQLLSLDHAQLSQQVTTALGSHAGLAAPCTAAVGTALPLLAGGSTIGAAVATVDASRK